MTQISAKIRNSNETRISQCDLFHDIDIVEKIKEGDNGIEITYIHFPMVICLNQDCDLNSDDRDKQNADSNKNCRLLHLVIAPVFNFDLFKQGEHWGDIFQPGERYKASDTSTKKITKNEDPRFHYLHFGDDSKLPDMIIDFKHCYTVSTDTLYANIDNRFCSLSDLYREKISQRFAYFISRIGLP